MCLAPDPKERSEEAPREAVEENNRLSEESEEYSSSEGSSTNDDDDDRGVFCRSGLCNQLSYDGKLLGILKLLVP